MLARTHARLEPAERALHAEGVPSRRAGNRGRAPALSEILRVLRRAAPGAGAKSALVDALAETTETAGSTEEAAALEEAGAHLGRLVDDHGVEEPRPTVGSFLAWLAANRGGTEVAGWERQGAGSSELGDDAVTLATFHQAKGLEWPMVAVVGLETGTMPIAYAVGEEAQAEERRLLYVALTRAESELWCSWAAQSSDGAAPPRPRGPSPLLEPVRQVIEAQAPLGPRDALARLDHVRRRLAAAG